MTEHWAKARYSRSTSRPRFSSLRNSSTHLQGTGLPEFQPGERSCPGWAWNRHSQGPSPVVRGAATGSPRSPPGGSAVPGPEEGNLSPCIPNMVCPQGDLQLPQNLCGLLNSPLKLGTKNKRVWWVKPRASHRPTEREGSSQQPLPAPHDWPFTLSLPHHLHTPAWQIKHLRLHMAPYTDEHGAHTDLHTHRHKAHARTHAHPYTSTVGTDMTPVHPHMDTWGAHTTIYGPKGTHSQPYVDTKACT